MNSGFKVRSLEALPRVRKRKSTSIKPTTHNAAQRRSFLLNNNRTLALTLQETRCELSNYKKFFQESRECIDKAKLAKLKMIQLSTTLEDFKKAFDETLLMLEFSDFEWPDVKASAPSFKNFQNGMNPVFEIADEVSAEHILGCDEGNGPTNPAAPLRKEIVSERETEPDHPIQISIPDSQSGEGDAAPRAGEQDFSQEKPSLVNDIDFENPSRSILPSQTVKATKIPRCRVLSHKRQESKQKNKAFLPQKSYKESDSNLLRRKTFLIKNSQIPGNSEAIVGTNHSPDEDDGPGDVNNLKNKKRKTFMKKNSNLLTNPRFTNSLKDLNQDDANKISNNPNDALILQNDKRKTFVKKKSNVVTEDVNENWDMTDDALNLKNDKRKTFVKKCSNVLTSTRSISNFNVLESQDVETNNESGVNNDSDDVFFTNDKRKTFVMKSSDITALCQKDENFSGHQQSPPSKAHISVNSELASIGTEKYENLEAPLHLQFNLNGSRTDQAVSSNESVSDVKNDIHTSLEVSSMEAKKIENIVITDELNVSDRTKTVASKQSDVMNRAVIFGDDSLRDSHFMNVNSIASESSQKTYPGLSESEHELIVLDNIDLSGGKKAVKAAPIRRRILSNKEKKFVFKSKKRKSAVKKKSVHKMTHSKTYDDFLEESTENCQSNLNDAVSNNDENNVNESYANEQNAVNFISDELISEDILDDRPLNSSGVKGKTSKTSSRKMKANQAASARNTGKPERKSTKTETKKSSQSKDITVDDLTLPLKKTKKRTKEKKKDHCFDDGAISKFTEEDKIIKNDKVGGTAKNSLIDLACKKIGENTFLVEAEIHPPPSSLNRHDVEDFDKENEKLNQQVAVVLNDVLKSRDIGLLNLHDKNLLCSLPAKMVLSDSSNNIPIDPEESIEKFRCDQVLDMENPKTRRRRGEVNYKEPPVNRKMRRY